MCTLFKSSVIRYLCRTNNVNVSKLNGYCSSSLDRPPGFGLLVDIDGVVVRGSSVIDEAVPAFQRLINVVDGQFVVPTVFITNSNSCDSQTRAQQLSQLLNVRVTHNQVVMGHSPLEWLASEFDDRRVLVCGQQNARHMASSVGFKRLCTLENVRTSQPSLDVMDLRRRQRLAAHTASGAQSADSKRPRSVGALLLLQEPVRWETALQLIVDVLLTDGQMTARHRLPPPPQQRQLPVIACSADLQWMSEAENARLGHGAFLTCLETLYSRLTGGVQLQYTHMVGKPYAITYQYAIDALNRIASDMRPQGDGKQESIHLRSVYCIGDNPSVDVLGANLHNSRLQKEQDFIADNERQRCVSVHVRTGVDSHPLISAAHAPSNLQPLSRDLLSPAMAFDNILEAVNEILKLEDVD